MSFRSYLLDNLDRDDLINISQHGADGGFNGLIWSKDMMDCYLENEDEILTIWQDSGMEFPTMEDCHSLGAMVDRLVWGAAEMLAEELAEELEDAEAE